MTRRRRRQSHKEHRDANRIASRRLVVPSISKSDLSLFEDRRRFNPDGPLSSAKSFSSSHTQLREKYHRVRPSEAQRSQVPDFHTPEAVIGRMGFKDPDDVLICVRRKSRREVLFAKRKTGRRGQKPKKYNYYSDVICKRRK